jgi:hypothetical protein
MNGYSRLMWGGHRWWRARKQRRQQQSSMRRDVTAGAQCAALL